eukprot:CAMPEP_0198155108 /NCGR_PEP_ID=MMETSP1443-20131203/68966_1 /TAXON_ID=186043 /ORGANISM="Entomoneis sp., Strain CCMP2396" /LENGTH=349 /DNA_ID=CAMNT_0043821849 /DNA_START=106 /DNA_END=1155 /DNA_ORIENTATION=+
MTKKSFAAAGSISSSKQSAASKNHHQHNHDNANDDKNNITTRNLTQPQPRLNSEEPKLEENRLLCRFFFLQGNCRYKDQCAYSHTLPEGLDIMEARQHIPCPYFARGNCRYGECCELRHDPLDLNKNKPPPTTAKKLAAAGPAVARSSPASADDDHAAICGICLEDVTQAGHKFGLLSCCEHTFCFECLMEWRKEGSSEAQDRRSCPTCRKKSNYVVPSTVLAETIEEKDRIVQEYQTRLSHIPCKRFDETLGSCPYGKDCFYAHIDDTGKDCKPQDLSMQQLYEQRQRKHRSSASGSSSRQGRQSATSLQNEIDLITRMLLLDMYAYRGHGDDDDDSDNYWDDYFGLH